MPVTKMLGNSDIKLKRRNKDNNTYISKLKKKPAARLSGKLSCNWLIMLVTMATPISSHVKNKNSIFTACDEDMIS